MGKGERSRESLMEELESLKATISDLNESISQRNKADKESQSNLNIFHILNSLAPAGIYLTDTKGDCIYVNSSWLKMAGMKMEDALGVGWLRGIHPDDLEMVKSTWYHSQKNRTNWNLEYRFISSEGAVTWVRGMAAPYYDSTSKKLGYVGINMDITELMDIQNKLVKSEGKYKNLFKNALVGIFSSSLNDGKAFLANSVASSMLGYPSVEEFIEKFKTFDHYENPKDRDKLLKQVLEQDFTEKVVVKAKKLDGTRSWLECSFRLREDRGTVDCFIYDITERINIEEELRKSEVDAKRERDLSKQYLDIAEVILVSLDKNGNVQLINPKGCRVLGYKKEEISGKNWFDNFLPAKLRESVKEVSKMVYSGEMEAVKYYENEIITKLGDERTIGWHNSVLKDADGSIIGTLSSGEDITERKRAEAE